MYVNVYYILILSYYVSILFLFNFFTILKVMFAPSSFIKLQIFFNLNKKIDINFLLCSYQHFFSFHTIPMYFFFKLKLHKFFLAQKKKKL